MSWSEALLAFLVAHAAGDVLFQTESQALHKPGGLLDSGVSRNALTRHLTSYMSAFVPVLGWVARERGARRAVAVGALIAGPHFVIDDGRIVQIWLRKVKRVPEAPAALEIAVDQSFHLLSLLGASFLAAAR